jgi:6-phosphofructokinase 2
MQTIRTLTMNPAIDRSTSVDRVAPEIKLRCAPPQRDPGGGGLNVSRVICRLGGESRALYPAGGETGTLLHYLLEAEGIHGEPVATDSLTRENLTVFEEATGQQYRFGMPGEPLDQPAQNAILDRLREDTTDYVVASGSLPPGVPDDFYAEVARVTLARGARFVLDTSGAALKAAVNDPQRDRPIYLLKPNMRELAQMLGKGEIEDEETQVEAARHLVETGRTEIVVVSLGAAGALLAATDRTTRIRAPVVPIRSKVGAGDSMVGAMVFSLARGDSIDKAVRYGIAAGAAAVSTPGTELCQADMVHELYEKIAVE